MDRLFDKDSFQEEITNPSEAKACVDYLATNEHQFRQDLANEGLDYDQREAEMKTVWTNLVKSCQRVGYSDRLVEAKAKQYGVKK